VEYVASIFRVEDLRVVLLVVCFMLISCLAYSSILKVEATWSNEMSVEFQWITWCYIPETSFRKSTDLNFKVENWKKQ
jgi:hypothetical protein